MTGKQIKCEPHGWYDFAYGETEPIPCPKCVYLKADSPTPAQRAAYIVWEDGGKDYYMEGTAGAAPIEEQIILHSRAAIRERDARWKTYAHHKGGCAAFPATSEEQILRDCSCGLRALLEEAGK